MVRARPVPQLGRADGRISVVDVSVGAEETMAKTERRASPLVSPSLNPTLERVEREMVKAALHKHRGRMDDAAKAIGISRKDLYLKGQRLGL